MRDRKFRREGLSGRRQSLGLARRLGGSSVLSIPAIVRWGLAGFAATVVIVVVASNDHGKPVRTAIGFPVENIEAARLKVLPYRRSGLIFSWQGEEPTVFVARAKWDALSDEAKRDLGRAIAVAKDSKEIQIREEKSDKVIARCTAVGRCMLVTDGSNPSSLPAARPSP